ncbi:pre-mRNA-processing factor 19-like [Convolutriloba macropyga]|uniref:pre-mRNA-processing factor 19-like n=1 Tax=Convolutriloba macropyga TaxID=536237 RepID=UPI003F51FAD6
MALVCALSNEVPEKPCVAPSSGNVFERRLIEKFIKENGSKDPINGEPLEIEQLVDINIAQPVKAKPPSATSVPAILKALQDEWDAVMLNSFTLRQQLQTTRQELSHALYQHDAACRVIARLTKEVNAAREALSALKPQAGVTPSAPPSALTPNSLAQNPIQPSPNAQTTPQALVLAEPIGMTDEIINKLNENSNHLTTERKKRGKTVPEGLNPVDEVKGFEMKASQSGLHSASVPGILCVDVFQADDSKILTGGMDKMAIVSNRSTEQIVSQLKGHTKKVSHAVYHTSRDVAFTASADCTVATWNVPEASCSNVIKAHALPVTGLSLHATGDYILSCSEDKHWAFSDINSGQVISKVSESGDHTLTCAQFHPDGLIFSVGTSDAMVKIWDLKFTSNNAVATFPGHSGPISAISFSENGYYLATSADDAQIKLWDLRKLKNFKTIQLDSQYEVKSLAFDQSGTYLSVAGSDIRVYLCKQWDELCILTDHSSLATGVKFGNNADFVCSSSMDRTLKIFGSSSYEQKR